jgi:hypothetical protein
MTESHMRIPSINVFSQISMIARVRQTVGIAVIVTVSVAGLAYAQMPSGTITGVVTDASGARVADAEVSVANLHTGHRWTPTTSSEGIYSLSALLPGEYRVTVSSFGFNSAERDVTVEAGTTTTVDVALDIGAITSSVTVQATVPLLHRDDHQIGGVVKREQIENVPLNGRNVLELAKLEPGVMSPVRGAAGNAALPWPKRTFPGERVQV